MSRRKDNYENSRFYKFKRWFDGDVNLLEGVTEVTFPEEDGTGADAQTAGASDGLTGAGAYNAAGTDRAGNISALEARRRVSEETYGPEVWPQRETVDYAQWRRHAQELLDARIHPNGIGAARAESEGSENDGIASGNAGRPGDAGSAKAASGAAAGRPGDTGSGKAASGIAAGSAASPEPLVRGMKIFQRFYMVMSVLLCALIIGVFLWTTVHLPPFGSADNPANNEVPTRYIESGVAETGAINFVTGMILDYRAFDTFGESCVLFIASCCVLVLLRIDESNGKSRARSRGPQEDDRLFEPKNDVILQRAAFILVPFILVFGVYIVLNGHLSPGGGFSGGAVLGSGLILYLNAFGFAKTERFFTEKVYRRVTLCALTFYCLAKSYSFFTGANHLESGISLGTPGAILSSGLILPLNICVGLVVMCTMYAFYTLFRKGGM